ncbi:hypothetical protein [Alysiella crassa]|uniref:Uncharacterized protein n=1 Tax=Alysiella crassa TaxID=153491 RepID=A0A376BV05_9NEIS|nr:hypothetical protein [Alysiella crassa]UOP06176.1 hypothetical protein LVJ80_10110 [Alysiella crassa]SSY80648.1 Uncharacterised protein [Alysiella crassa]
MSVNQDPILQALKEIQAKQDVTIAKQDDLEKHIKQIHNDCKKTARTNGAVAGAVSGGLVATGIALIKAKFGL